MTRDETREKIAETVFNSPSFYAGHPEKVAWVPRGNSLKQDEARDLARRILALMPDPALAEIGRLAVKQDKARDAYWAKDPADHAAAWKAFEEAKNATDAAITAYLTSDHLKKEE